MELTQSAVVDLQESSAFNEPFYVVVVEKENDNENRQNDSFGYLDNKKSERRTKMQHCESLEGEERSFISTQLLIKRLFGSVLIFIIFYVGNTIVHVWKLVISSSGDDDQVNTSNPAQKRYTGPNVTMKTTKVCTKRLALPDGVGIIHASPAAGHPRYKSQFQIFFQIFSFFYFLLFIQLCFDLSCLFCFGCDGIGLH